MLTNDYEYTVYSILYTTYTIISPAVFDAAQRISSALLAFCTAGMGKSANKITSHPPFSPPPTNQGQANV